MTNVVLSLQTKPLQYRFVCKSHYLDCLIKELGIANSLGNLTYTCTPTKDDILDNHRSVLFSSKINKLVSSSTSVFENTNIVLGILVLCFIVSISMPINKLVSTIIDALYSYKFSFQTILLGVILSFYIDVIVYVFI